MRGDIQNLDFSLQKMLFSPEICAKVQGRTASLVVVPFTPQPVINRQLLAAAGLSVDDDHELITAVRLAFYMGLIGPDVAPIRVGSAFELLQALPPQKIARFGTGIVRGMGIARFDDLKRRHWLACGYPSEDEFTQYWGRSMPEAPAQTNPWCWLIHFEFKG